MNAGEHTANRKIALITGQYANELRVAVVLEKNRADMRKDGILVNSAPWGHSDRRADRATIRAPANGVRVVAPMREDGGPGPSG